MAGSFRTFVPSADDPRVVQLSAEDAYSHATRCLEIPWLRDIFDGWRRLYEQPFLGITTDGNKIPNLYSLASDGAPVSAMVGCAKALLGTVSSEQRSALCHAINAQEWRGWSNPEIYANHFGLRLDEIQPSVRQAVLELMRASLSPEGFTKARDLMYTNEFLGHLVHGPRVLNEYSYYFNLFGTPSLTDPWGWNLFGHHLALNCLVIGEQMVLSPVFMGAEPNEVDEGPRAGLKLLVREESLGLELMRSLPDLLQRQARVFEHMEDPAMPPGRVHPADGRHLGGAFQDNRLIPYEGVSANSFSDIQRTLLLDLIGTYLQSLPAGPFRARMRAVEQELQRTYFSWIGGFEDDSPFYYRIQSPVLLIEFDHHSGIFLTNTHPAKFHIHTLVRTPNGNDYGMELLHQHCGCSANAER